MSAYERVGCTLKSIDKKTDKALMIAIKDLELEGISLTKEQISLVEKYVNGEMARNMFVEEVVRLAEKNNNSYCCRY